jgi:hypothetical protein
MARKTARSALRIEPGLQHHGAPGSGPLERIQLVLLLVISSVKTRTRSGRVQPDEMPAQRPIFRSSDERFPDQPSDEGKDAPSTWESRMRVHACGFGGTAKAPKLSESTSVGMRAGDCEAESSAFGAALARSSPEKPVASGSVAARTK